MREKLIWLWIYPQLEWYNRGQNQESKQRLGKGAKLNTLQAEQQFKKQGAEL